MSLRKLITGYADINATSIGATTPGSGAFTTVAARDSLSLTKDSANATISIGRDGYTLAQIIGGTGADGNSLKFHTGGSLAIEIKSDHSTAFTGGAAATSISVGAQDVAIGGGEINAGGAVAIGSNLIVPKTSGIGIKVDTAAPTFPWFDLEGVMLFDPAGANSPSFATYQSGISQMQFVANDQVAIVFHMPHDWAPGTDMHVHVHWSHTGTAISGNAVFTVGATYAKGHNQANFPATKTQTITYNTTNIATTPQRRHRIDEIQLSDATGSGNYLNRGDFEVDGLIIVNVSLTTLPTITAGDLFVHHVDLHYQSTGIGTKQKAPNFYV